MADNVAITAGSGTSVATDDVGGVHYQKVKLAIGAADTANLLSVGSGAIDTGTPRFTLATDSPGVTTLGQAAMAASLPVVIASNQSTLNASPTPVTSGGLTIFRSLDLDETEEEVKATAGQLYKLRITNNATSSRYVKIYNATAANVTVGTTAPVDTIVVPPASSASNPTVLTESFGGQGVEMTTAITLAATTALADNDTGAPSANDVVVTAYYK